MFISFITNLNWMVIETMSSNAQSCLSQYEDFSLLVLTKFLFHGVSCFNRWTITTMASFVLLIIVQTFASTNLCLWVYQTCWAIFSNGLWQMASLASIREDGKWSCVQSCIGVWIIFFIKKKFWTIMFCFSSYWSFSSVIVYIGYLIGWKPWYKSLFLLRTHTVRNSLSVVLKQLREQASDSKFMLKLSLFLNF